MRRAVAALAYVAIGLALIGAVTVWLAFFSLYVERT